MSKIKILNLILRTLYANAIAWFLLGIYGFLKTGDLTPLLSAIAVISSATYLMFGANFRNVSRPPDWGLRNFAEFCFSKKTYVEILEPPLSDMQKEYFEALAEGRPWKARLSLVRNYCAFWSAILAQLPISLARLVYKIWKTTKTGS